MFPENPFPDVDPEEFHKLNKKEVTEDFVSENLRNAGWKVSSFFADTGIDRMISKRVCPNNHTSILEGSVGEKCPDCDADTIEIRRFLQIKTREVKGDKNMFGFTLTPSDFRTDPRHTFVLYSDNTRDIMFISVYEYLKFFKEIDYQWHSTPTFKQGNGKLNNWRYDESSDKWYFTHGRGRGNNYSWEEYRNDEGLKKMQNPEIDKNLEEYIEKTKSLKMEEFKKLKSGRTFDEEPVEEINDALEILKNKDRSKILEERKDTIHFMEENLGSSVKKSIQDSYWFKYKNLNIKKNDYREKSKRNAIQETLDIEEENEGGF